MTTQDVKSLNKITKLLIDSKKGYENALEATGEYAHLQVAMNNRINERGALISAMQLYVRQHGEEVGARLTTWALASVRVPHVLAHFSVECQHPRPRQLLQPRCPATIQRTRHTSVSVTVASARENGRHIIR